MSSKSAVPAQASANPHTPSGGPGSPEAKLLADRFGALDVQVQRFKPIAKLHEGLRHEIQALYEASQPDLEFVLKGDLFEIQISARENERKILSMRKLAKAVKDAFFDHCSFPMKIIDALLPGEKQAGLVATSRTGSRSVKAIPLAEEKAA